MEEKDTLLETLIEKGELYTKTSIDLIKLKTIEKSANAFSSIISSLIISSLILFIVMMVNIGAALWIGNCIESLFCGFFIVAGFYVFIVLILLIFKNQILKTPLINSIINNIRN